MATPYEDVYQYFLSKISDYAFLKMSDEDLKDMLYTYLKTAINQFEASVIDLSQRDDLLEEFEADLPEKEIDILAGLMMVAYLKSRLLTSENYKLAMADSDYKIYSQANHIKELTSLYKEMRKEMDVLVTKYSYKNQNWGEKK